MDYLINESTIRHYLGGASFVSGLICFAYGSTYDKLFGKLGFGGLIVYLGISLSIFYLIWGFMRIRVPERFQVVVETILSVAICVISVGLDKLVPRKSDALSIISYGLFALMSGSTSRKSELGFETGFFSFFLSLFLEEIYKTNLKLFPFAVIFCLFSLVLRHRSQSARSNGDHPQEVAPPNAVAIDIGDEESQYSPQQSLLRTSNQENNQEESYEAAHHPPNNNGGVSEESTSLEETRSSFPATRLQSPSNYGQVSEAIIGEIRPSFSAGQDSPGMGEVSGQSLLSTDNQQNNQEESSQARHHSPEIVQVSDESMLDWVNQNQDEEDPWSFPPESWEQEQVSSGNNQNGWMHSSAGAGLLSAEPSGLRRRSRWITTGIKDIPSRVGAKLGRWRWQVVVPAFFFFEKINP